MSKFSVLSGVIGDLDETLYRLKEHAASSKDICSIPNLHKDVMKMVKHISQAQDELVDIREFVSIGSRVFRLKEGERFP